MGNVGREVMRGCLQLELPVRAAGQDEAALQKAFPGEQVVRFDFLDRSTWAAAITDCHAVFLLRPPPIGNMETTLCPFIDAFYAAGGKHIVFLSVAGADRMKWVPHRKVELHLESKQESWTVLRPGFFAQNLKDAYLHDILKDDRIYVPAGKGRVAFLDVYDVGDVAAKIFAGNQPFDHRFLTLTGPAAIGFDEVAALLSASLGRKIQYEPATIPGYLWHLRQRQGLPWIQCAIQTILHVGLRTGDAETVDPAIELILGRTPRDMATYARNSASRWKVS
jgi:uncharacterized protein YbjT (DUF2867 family)